MLGLMKKTTDQEFSECIERIEELDKSNYDLLKTTLLNANKECIENFMAEFAQSLGRVIERLVIVPLYGRERVFGTYAEAIEFVRVADGEVDPGAFRKYEVLVNFTNGDKIDANFRTGVEVEKFLKYIAS